MLLLINKFKQKQKEILKTFEKMFKAYSIAINKHPLMTKMLTLGLICSFGDLITQLFITKNKNFDFRRNLNFAVTGIFYTAPMLHIWHSKMIPKLTNILFTQKTPKIRRVLGLVAVTQIGFAPILILGFYLINNFFKSLSVQGLWNGVRRIKEKFAQTLVMNWTIWPIFTGINFWFIPIIYRVLFSNLIGLFWNMILSYQAYDSKIKQFKIGKQNVI